MNNLHYCFSQKLQFSFLTFTRAVLLYIDNVTLSVPSFFSKKCFYFWREKSLMWVITKTVMTLKLCLFVFHRFAPKKALFINLCKSCRVYFHTSLSFIETLWFYVRNCRNKMGKGESGEDEWCRRFICWTVVKLRRLKG